MKTSHLTLCLFFLFFIAACQSQDEIPIQQETQRRIVSSVDIPQVTSSLLNQLGLRNGGERFSVYSEGNGLGVAIDWDKVKQLIDTSGKQTYTFAIEDQDNDPNTFYNLIFQLTADNEPFKPYLLKYTMDDAFAESYKSGAASFDSFRGSVKKIWVQGFGNQNTSGSTLNNDGSEVIVGDECPRVTQFNNGNGSYGSGGVYVGIPPSGGGDVELLQCEVFVQATDWWTCVSSGGSTYCHITETTYEMSYENCGLVPAMSSSDDDGLCQPTDDNIPIILPDLEIILDPTFLNTKVECVYNKLESMSGGFKNAIKMFDGEFPVAHLRFSVSNTLSSTSAASTIVPVGTTSTPDYVITIAFNGSQSAQAGIDFRPSLLTAKTLAHEVIHAEMYRKLMSLINEGTLLSLTGGTLDALLANGDFPGIYDYYRRFGKGWQHEQMAAHYVETIADITSEFDGGTQSNQFYWDLAWEGLKGTQAWIDLAPSEKTRITNTINNYIIANHNDACN
jgi:hypothetical protein